MSYIQNYFKSVNLDFEFRISPHTNFLNKFTHNNTHINENIQSLTSNYASIIYECYYNNFETFVILEDDNIFDQNFEEEFTLFYEHLPNDWNVIHLSDYDDENHIRKNNVNDYCDRIFVKYATNCMVFRNPRKYKFVADACVNSRYPIDYILNSLYVEDKLICYASRKSLTHQLSYRDVSENQSQKMFKSLIFKHLDNFENI
jgi:GR25 family glycosyltransferase involved in LPS biosynthesis